MLASCTDKNKAELRLNLEKGKKYEFLKVNEKNGNGRKSTITNGYTWEVKNIDKDGNYEITVTFGKTETQDAKGMKGNGLIPDNQSEGLSFDIVMTPLGKVTSIKGIDQVLDGMVKKGTPIDSVAGMNDGDFGADFIAIAMKGQYKDDYNDKKITYEMEQLVGYLSDGPKEKDNTWTGSISATLPSMRGELKASIKSDYKLIELGEGYLVLETTSGKEKGTIKVDRKTGLPISGTFGVEEELKDIAGKTIASPCKVSIESKQVD